MIYPSFSVVVTVYKGSKASYILECFNSLNGQTYLPSEVIIVIDGPISAGLLTFCESFLFDVKIKKKIIKCKYNKGPGSARNTGVNSTTSDYVAIMDSDDICYPERFELQIRALSCGDIDIVGGHISEFQTNFKNDKKKPSRSIYLSDRDIKLNYKKTIPVNNVTAMFRRSSFLNVGGYPELRFGEDLVLWYRLVAANYKFLNVDEVLVGVRLGEDFLDRRMGKEVFNNELKYLSILYRENHMSMSELVYKVIKSFIVRHIPKNIYTYLRGKYN